MDQVVDVFRVGRGARDEAPDGLLVSIVELAESTDLAARELTQEVGVGRPRDVVPDEGLDSLGGARSSCPHRGSQRETHGPDGESKLIARTPTWSVRTTELPLDADEGPKRRSGAKDQVGADESARHGAHARLR